MVANNTLCNASAYLKKLFLICGSKPHLICRMTIKGCAITVGVGVVIWGTVQLCKKMKEKRKADGGNENKEDIYENTDVHATAD